MENVSKKFLKENKKSEGEKTNSINESNKTIKNMKVNHKSLKKNYWGNNKNDLIHNMNSSSVKSNIANNNVKSIPNSSNINSDSRNKTNSNNLINQLSNFFAGFGIDFPNEEINQDFYSDSEYNQFISNFSSHFSRDINGNFNILEIIRYMLNRDDIISGGTKSKPILINKKVVSKLKKFKMNKTFCKLGNRMEIEHPSCCICISPIKTGEDTILIKCGHMFHHLCVSEWFKNKNSCPMCRYDLQI